MWMIRRILYIMYITGLFVTPCRSAFVSSCRQYFTSLRPTRLSSSSSSPSAMATTSIVGVVFDMDGTLVKPCIDFADMRQRIYQLASQDMEMDITEGCVLELTSKLSSDGQVKATTIFNDIEDRAIQSMTFMDGLVEICQWLDERDIRRAVLTRNVEKSVHALHNKLWTETSVSPFCPAVARDTVDRGGSVLPAKPLPNAIHFICQEWNCDPCQVVMVGDSAKDDVVAANRAGCMSVLLSGDEDNDSGNEKASTSEERTPTLVVSSLLELKEVLVKNPIMTRRRIN